MIRGPVRKIKNLATVRIRFILNRKSAPRARGTHEFSVKTNTIINLDRAYNKYTKPTGDDNLHDVPRLPTDFKSIMQRYRYIINPVLKCNDRMGFTY